jgi:hypothetical protein
VGERERGEGESRGEERGGGTGLIDGFNLCTPPPPPPLSRSPVSARPRPGRRRDGGQAGTLHGVARRREAAQGVCV